jgi:uncharacterized phage-associated protein
MTAKTLVRYVIAFLNRKGDQVSNKKIQKLLYYIEAWHLVHFSSPLIDEEFEAWVYGPVIPSVYRDLKKYGYDNLSLASKTTGKSMDDEELETEINNFPKESGLNTDQVSLINDVLLKYGNLSSQQLEFLTHSEDPWKVARGDIPPNVNSSSIIDKNQMVAFYSKMIDGQKS